MFVRSTLRLTRAVAAAAVLSGGLLAAPGVLAAGPQQFGPFVTNEIFYFTDCGFLRVRQKDARF